MKKDSKQNNFNGKVIFHGPAQVDEGDIFHGLAQVAGGDIMLRFVKLEELPDDAINCAKIMIKCRNNLDYDTPDYIEAEESFYDAVMDIFEAANKNINLKTCVQKVFDQIAINREELISKIERMCED